MKKYFLVSEPNFSLPKNLHEFEGIYFGNEFCAELAPSKSELKLAVDLCSSRNMRLVYVTSPVGEKDTAQIITNLYFLDSLGKKTEVVVNDWGILGMVAEKFENLKLILGRLLVKNRRMAHFSSFPKPSLEKISSSAHGIIKVQESVASKTNLNIREYASFLRLLGVERVGLDIPRTGIDLGHIPDFKIDVYSSTAYVTGGRLCRIAGAFEKKRRNNILNKECPKYCLKEKLCFLPNHDSRIFYRYNSIFLKQDEAEMKKFLELEKGRISRVIV